MSSGVGTAPPSAHDGGLPSGGAGSEVDAAPPDTCRQAEAALAELWILAGLCNQNSDCSLIYNPVCGSQGPLIGMAGCFLGVNREADPGDLGAASERYLDACGMGASVCDCPVPPPARCVNGQCVAASPPGCGANDRRYQPGESFFECNDRCCAECFCGEFGVTCTDACEPVTRLCPSRESPADCDSVPGCQWSVPGCGNGAGLRKVREGCYATCSDDRECGPSATCDNVWVNPCAGSDCLACGATARVCR